MSTLEAALDDRRRVLFSARGRSAVNVRTLLEDGPVGFTSGELLLGALANCSLGTLTNHPLVQEAGFVRAAARLDAESADDPPRIARITLAIDLWVHGTSLAGREAELAAIARASPMANSLAAEKHAFVRLNPAEPAASPDAPVEAAAAGGACLLPGAVPAR